MRNGRWSRSGFRGSVMVHFRSGLMVNPMLSVGDTPMIRLIWLYLALGQKGGEHASGWFSGP